MISIIFAHCRIHWLFHTFRMIMDHAIIYNFLQVLIVHWIVIDNKLDLIQIVMSCQPQPEQIKAAQFFTFFFVLTHRITHFQLIWNRMMFIFFCLETKFKMKCLNLKKKWTRKKRKRWTHWKKIQRLSSSVYKWKMSISLAFYVTVHLWVDYSEKNIQWKHKFASKLSQLWFSPFSQ